MRLDAIDVLRGLAALVVVVFHARSTLWTGISNLYSQYGLGTNLSAWIGYATYPFSYGWLGVTVFFALSGYCIHRRGAGLLAKQKDAKLDIVTFLKRRFWRIYPTYLAALVLSGLVDWYLIRTTTLEEPRNCCLTYDAFIVSLFALQGYVSPFFSTNIVFWTLAMEIHLYLAYPLLFYVSKRRGPAAALALAAIASFAFVALDAALVIQHRFPFHFVRGPIFLPYWLTWTLGFYLAEVEAGRAMLPSRRACTLVVSLAALVAAVLVELDQPEHAEIFLAPVAAAVVYSSLRGRHYKFWDGRLAKALSFVGVFSYSLYAIHYPVLLLAKSWIVPGETKPESLLPTLAGVALSMLTGYLFFLVVERWSLRAHQVVVKPA